MVNDREAILSLIAASNGGDSTEALDSASNVEVLDSDMATAALLTRTAQFFFRP